MNLDRARIVNELNCAADDDDDAAAFVVMDDASWVDVVDLAADADGIFVVAAVESIAADVDSAGAFVDVLVACNYYLQSSLESQ